MKQKLLRWILLLLLTLGISTFCGCLPAVELNNRAIVQAVGVDYDKENQQFQVALQIYSPTGGGKGSLEAGGDQNAKIIESTGSTLTEAIRNATLKQGKTIFYGHNRVIIVGEDAAVYGIDRLVSFFNSNSQSRLNTGMLVAKGTASSILKTRVSEGILPAEALEKMLENSRENGKISEVSYLDIAKALENQTDDVIIPAIRINSQAEQEGREGEETQPAQSIEMSGTAVFCDGKLAGYLDEEETRGLMWLRGDLTKTVMVSSTEKIALFSVEIYRANTHLSCIQTTPPYQYRLDASVSGAVKEVILRDENSILEESDYREMEEQLAKMIRQESQKALERAVFEYHADVAHFGNLIWQADPPSWRKNRSEFSEDLRKISVKDNIQVSIDRIGLESRDKPKE